MVYDNIMIESEDIALDKNGIRVPDPKSGKLVKFIPWGMINRERIIPNIDKMTGRTGIASLSFITFARP